MIKLALIAVALVLGFQWFQDNYVLEATWKGEPIFDTDHGIIKEARSQAISAPSAGDGFDEFR